MCSFPGGKKDISWFDIIEILRYNNKKEGYFSEHLGPSIESRDYKLGKVKIPGSFILVPIVPKGYLINIC